MSRHKPKQRPKRNVIAFAARCRAWGAGHHGDAKKEDGRRKCRGKVRVETHTLEPTC